MVRQKAVASQGQTVFIVEVLVRHLWFRYNKPQTQSLTPTTAATFSVACLTQPPFTPSPTSLPLKHTLVRTAIINGAVFEINQVGALGGENEEILVEEDAAENGPGAKRNWWAAGRELKRLTKEKGLIVSSGVVAEMDLWAPSICSLKFEDAKQVS